MAKQKAAASRSGRRRLGRGLGSLITAPVQVEIPAESTAKPVSRETSRPPVQVSSQAAEGGLTDAGGVKVLALVNIQPNPSQPRQQFDETALASLAESIRSAGLMQPIVVRPRGADNYEIIAGERRWRAARMIGLQRIPAVVREVGDHEAAEWSLIENIQREDLNPIERAQAFRRLIDDYKMTQQQVAERVGIDRSNVANHLRLLDLDDVVQGMVLNGLLSLGQSRAMLAIADVKKRQAFAAKAVRDGWTVRIVEQKVRQLVEGAQPVDSQSGSKRSGIRGSAHLQDLEKRLGEHLGTKVEIKQGRGKGAGRLMIQFYNNDQFEGVLDRLGFSVD